MAAASAVTKMADLKGEKPSTVRQRILSCLAAVPEAIPCFIWGPPGIGKSALIAQIAHDLKVALCDLRMYLLNPVDLRGIPVADLAKGIAKWLVPEFMPKEGNGILFLDELNVAPQAVQASAYQLIYDRRCGDYALPDGWKMIAAGNRAEDRGLTFEMPSPLRRRVLHLEMKPDIDDFVHWGMANGLAPEVAAFIRWRGDEYLYQFSTAYTRSFPCPATWDYVSRLIRGGSPVTDENMPLFAGTVGDAAAGEFISYVQVFGELPDAEDILWNGKLKTPAPPATKPDRLYAFTASLASAASRAPQGKELDAAKRLLAYTLDQMPPEFGVKTAKDFMQTPRYKSLKKLLAATPEAKRFSDKWGILIRDE
jgi:hypothetical protein